LRAHFVERENSILHEETLILKKDGLFIMSNLKTVYLHIGTHKTGTTSIQKYMYDYNKSHMKFSIDYYKGLHNPKNHVELHAAAMKRNRRSPFKFKSKINVDKKYKHLVQNRVMNFLNSTKANKVVFSAEGLSYLRYDDELSYLKQLFKGAKVYIIIYLREKSSFLRSYRSHLIRTGYSLSDVPNSYAYVQDDTWLLEYHDLINIYGSHFGHDRLIILNYDEVMVKDGNVIPSFLKTIGIPSKLSDTSSYWYNKSPNK
jgi:hypothetical protein